MATTKASQTAQAKKAAAKKAATTPAAPVEATPVSDWKKPNKPVVLPGGNAMKIRKVGFQAFMRAGVIPNSLMATVQSAIDKGVEPDLDLGEISGDPKKLQDMLDMVDDVLMFVSVEPKVHPLPMTTDAQGVKVEDIAAKDDDLLYIDEVDDEDKMFIFQLCTGGTDDVEQFRSESADSLAAIQRG